MADKFNPRKKRYIEPEYFKMDLSRFRFSTRNGWNEITPATQRSVSRVSFYFGIELYNVLSAQMKSGFSRFTGGLSSDETVSYAKPGLASIFVLRNCHDVDLPNYAVTVHLFTLIV